MRLAEHVDQRRQRIDAHAAIGLLQQPFRLRLVEHAGRTRLPERIIGHHLDEEIRPFRRFLDLGALDGEEFLGRLAGDDAVGEHFAAQPGDVHGGDFAANDHRADDRTAAIDGEWHPKRSLTLAALRAARP